MASHPNELYHNIRGSNLGGLVAAHSSTCQCFRYLVERILFIFFCLGGGQGENKRKHNPFLYKASLFLFVYLLTINYTKILCREQKQLESSYSILNVYICRVSWAAGKHGSNAQSKLRLPLFYFTNLN